MKDNFNWSDTDAVDKLALEQIDAGEKLLQEAIKDDEVELVALGIIALELKGMSVTLNCIRHLLQEKHNANQ